MTPIRDKTPMRCGAKTRGGKPCQSWAVTGRNRCRMHGGSTPRGADLPQTKTGRWSKDLPTRLAAKYHEALADTQLLELRDELAIIDTRLAEILGGIDTGEAGEMWAQLRSARQALDASDPKKRAEAQLVIVDLIDRGAAAWQQWDDVFRTIERRARIAESERRRLVEMQQMISAEQLNVLVAALVATVRQHVKDADALRGISADIGRLLSVGSTVRH